MFRAWIMNSLSKDIESLSSTIKLLKMLGITYKRDLENQISPFTIVFRKQFLLLHKILLI